MRIHLAGSEVRLANIPIARSGVPTRSMNQWQRNIPQRGSVISCSHTKKNENLNMRRASDPGQVPFIT